MSPSLPVFSPFPTYKEQITSSKASITTSTPYNSAFIVERISIVANAIGFGFLDLLIIIVENNTIFIIVKLLDNETRFVMIIGRVCMPLIFGIVLRYFYLFHRFFLSENFNIAFMVACRGEFLSFSIFFNTLIIDSWWFFFLLLSFTLDGIDNVGLIDRCDSSFTVVEIFLLQIFFSLSVFFINSLHLFLSLLFPPRHDKLICCITFAGQIQVQDDQI